MDVEVTLATMRSAIKAYHRAIASCDRAGDLGDLEGAQQYRDEAMRQADIIAESADALDNWLSRKGALPRSWER